MHQPISRTRFFSILLSGTVLTILIMSVFGNDRIFNSLYWFNVKFLPGIMFGLAIPLALRMAFKAAGVGFTIGSVAIYYGVVITYMSEVYGGSMTLPLIALILGAIGELLMFGVLFGLLRDTKWWHLALAAIIGGLSLFILNIGLAVYPAIAFWQFSMGGVFYAIARTASKGLNGKSDV